MFGHFVKRCCMGGMLVLLLSWSFSPQAYSQEAERPIQLAGTETQQEQWTEGLALLSQGKLDAGIQRIEQLKLSGIEDERVEEIHDWLAAYQQRLNERQTRIESDYEKYVAWAKEDLAAGRRHQAISSAGRAFDVARDKEAFRQLSWTQEIAEQAYQRAEEYEEDGKWFPAARIYAQLDEIWPDHASYSEDLERCQEHIRLELSYDEDSEWEAKVAGITPEMAHDAFRKIAADYLKKPNFKEEVLGALDQILMLANTPKLAETFEKLSDEDAKKEFLIRVGIRRKYVAAKDTLNAGHLRAYMTKVLEINDEIKIFPEEVLVREYAYGALQPLDKFSDMIWPSDVIEFKKNTQGSFSGVGIQIRKNAGEPILVVSPLRDSPAYAAGIRPGDRITKINGKSASKYSITRAVREITGPVGTTVKLTIRREGKAKEFDVPLKRQEIHIVTVKGAGRDADGDWKFMIDEQEKIAFIRLTNFNENSFDELVSVVSDLKANGMRGLIFDLRDNPGGPLTAAVNVSDFFLPTDSLIVSTRDRNGTPWEVSSSNPDPNTDFPMIVLVSPYSASASEIVTGALKVHGRALVLGERTYGKGSVQQVLPLRPSQMAYLKLTTQLYYLPNGRCLHKEEDSESWGVDPDIEDVLKPKERLKLYDLWLKWDILKGKNQESLSDKDLETVTTYRPTTTKAADGQDETVDEEATTAPAEDAVADDEDPDEDEDEPFVDREDPNEYPEMDPQLDLALTLMRVRLRSGMPWPELPGDMVADSATSTGN